MADIPRYIGNYYLGENLGSGYSGSIFRATHIHTGELVALKVQHVNHECPTNRYERHLYPSLQGGEGMPTLWACGVEGAWDYLAIDLLGASLDNLYRKSGEDTMDLSSVCSIAMQLITRLEFMHSRGILHRDIQLGNCVIGLPPNEKTIYMIDFGFSKRYIDPYTQRHIPDSRAKRDFIGNYWFSSVGVHCRGKVPSRRDDLEAAALMFIHLLTPRGLPWTRNGVPKSDEAHDRLMKAKKAARPEDLCRGLPAEFEEFLRYCRRLQFQECPDYERWREEFRALAVEHGFPESEDFIWPPQKFQTKPHLKTPRRSHAPAPEDVERILNDLTNLDLGDPVLGDRETVNEAVRQAKDAAKDDSSKNSQPMEVIDITSDSDSDVETIPPPHLTPKAYRLAKLTKRASEASDNLILSELVVAFVDLLKSYTSRTLTKEGFAFIDTLYKQLADPSVFVLPQRQVPQRRVSSTDIYEKEPAHVKLGVVARLRREVLEAKSNKALAKMVADFEQVSSNSAGRTITKDGFAFLDGLADRLKALAVA
ncbi:kinase-like domain-containing protein [Mycena galopus ATCC 62051]|nr:kinase-like domain-containing protein [Mycena galopus ATCC 62051]